ncbi:MAG: IS630 family transposase [Gammaproteobacteria bacterium]|nr:IS630 family transposase [Gammaproteobacteria bacterium]
MDKEDARKLSPETQEQLRKQAIRLKKQGKKYVEIAEIVGVHRNTISNWWKTYEKEGPKGLKSKQRGFEKGQWRTLEASQELEIQGLMMEQTPDQFKLVFALWTRQAVQELIRIRFKIRMPIRTVGEYLKRWGFTPQKPLKRAYEQCPAEVQRWLDEEYPSIAERAKREGAVIHWGDETGVRSDCQHGRGYSPEGKPPVIRFSAKRTSINMISSITNQGKVRFMIYKDSMNGKMFIKFIKQLIKDADKKIFLVLDNMRVAHARVVKAWLKDYTEQIELFFLPAYSPELDPDEYLNGDLKAGVHSRLPARDTDGLNKKVRSHMKKLQRSPERVKRYFKHPKISYAA